MREGESVTAFLSHLPDDVSLNHRLIYHKFFCKLPVRIQENNAWLIFNDKENIHGIVTAYDNAWKSCRPPPTSWSELPSITRCKRRRSGQWPEPTVRTQVGQG